MIGVARRKASLAIAGLYAPNPSIKAIAPPSLIDGMVQVPFQAGSLAVDDTDHLESVLSQYQAAASADDGVAVSTQLPQVLAAASNDEHTSTSIVLVIDFEMLLLTVFALDFVASWTAAERLPDVQSQCCAATAPVAHWSSPYSSPLPSSSPPCPRACS